MTRNKDKKVEEHSVGSSGESKAHKTPGKQRRRQATAGQQQHENADDKSAAEDNNSSGDEPKSIIVKMFAEIRNSQNFLSAKFDSFEKKLEELMEDNKKMKTEISTLTGKIDRQQVEIDGLNNEVNTMKQHFLAKDVVISGLPDLNNVSCEKIVKVIGDAYEIGMDKISNIYISKGFSKITKTTYNNITVTFNDINTKNRILQHQKEIGPVLWGQLMDGVAENLCSRQIFIAERLTPFNLALLNACRELRAKKKIAFAWSKFGTIFVKTNSDSNRMKIMTQIDLDNLKTALAS
jgi:hypothetical protein